MKNALQVEPVGIVQGIGTGRELEFWWTTGPNEQETFGFWWTNVLTGERIHCIGSYRRMEGG